MDHEDGIVLTNRQKKKKEMQNPKPKKALVRAVCLSVQSKIADAELSTSINLAGIGGNCANWHWGSR
jgi:hypothetical protein